MERLGVEFGTEDHHHPAPVTPAFLCKKAVVLTVLSLPCSRIDHWNHEKERVVVLTDLTLLICKYDFIMLKCLQVQKVPLNYIDKVCLGSFAFPEKSLER